MKTIGFILFLGISAAAYSQVIPDEEFHTMVNGAKENCQGAHESVVRGINEEFASSIWGKAVRLNEADVVRFTKHPSGEKVSLGMDLTSLFRNSWAYEFDQKTAADFLASKGIKVSTSYKTLWINANQPIVLAETREDGHKTTLELYCPVQDVLDMVRTGRTQSIEFLVTGYRGSVTASSKIYGILTKVNTEKQVVRCTNDHEFDKDLGYKFCPTCGEPLE